MNRLLVFAALVGGFASGARAQDPPKSAWDEVRSKDGNYIVWMPSKAKYSKETAPTAIGDIEMHMNLATVGESRAYISMHGDYPPEIGKGDAEKMLDGARNGAIANMKAKLLKERKKKLSGFPGRAVTFETGTGEGEMRIYLVKHRVYQVSGISEKGKGDAAELAKVLDSFKLIEEE